MCLVLIRGSGWAGAIVALSFGFPGLAFCFAGAAFEFVVGVHGASALSDAAIAVAVVVVGVVQVVLVDELFTGGDVADGANEDAAIVGFGFAVGCAGVVEKHGDSEAIDDIGAAVDAKEVGDDAVSVALVGLSLGDARAVVLGDDAATADGVKRVAAGGVDGRGADDEARSSGHWVEYSKGREQEVGIGSRETAGCVV